jgi:hypothetical protein
MSHREIQSPVEWARRVNRAWLVRGNLNERTEAWLDHLASSGDGRLLESCATARAMCGCRQHEEDPKPWFYSGIFSLATAEEARRFLEHHRVTKATVPAMADDPEVLLWLGRVGPETRDLLVRLREGLASVSNGGGAQVRKS